MGISTSVNKSTVISKSTVIDGIAATEDRDSQGEILDLRGANIDEIVTKGVWNDNHSTGFNNCLGKITFAKKIFKESDIGSPRERELWNQVDHKPYLYVKGYLFDGEKHANANAVGAILREFSKNGSPLSVRMSVEGKVIKRDSHDQSILRESMIRNVALTLVPANSNTSAHILSEDAKTAILDKCKRDGGDVGYASNLMKSLEGEVQPLQRRFIEVNDSKNPYDKVFQNIREINKRVRLIKMLSVGNGAGGPPSTRVGGAALIEEKASKHLTSTTVEPKDWDKRKKQDVLKTLIRKTKEQNLDMSYDDIVEKTLSVFHKKFYKGE